MICDRERQRERMLRVNTETTERVDVARRRRVRTCLSLSVNKLPESSRANPVRFLPSYEPCYKNILTVADTETPDCHSKVRITFSPRFTKLSSINVLHKFRTSGLCCSVVSNLNDS